MHCQRVRGLAAVCGQVDGEHYLRYEASKLTLTDDRQYLKLSYTRSTAAISKACRHGLMSVHSAPYALLRPPVEMNLRELDPVEQLPCASAWSLNEEGLIAEPVEDLRHTLTSA